MIINKDAKKCVALPVGPDAVLTSLAGFCSTGYWLKSACIIYFLSTNLTRVIVCFPFWVELLHHRQCAYTPSKPLQQFFLQRLLFVFRHSKQIIVIIIIIVKIFPFP
jgi:hypothetical protein